MQLLFVRKINKKNFGWLKTKNLQKYESIFESASACESRDLVALFAEKKLRLGDSRDTVTDYFSLDFP
jgi:hypothetical protein